MCHDNYAIKEIYIYIYIYIYKLKYLSTKWTWTLDLRGKSKLAKNQGNEVCVEHGKTL
jgi:hypothetical protein